MSTSDVLRFFQQTSAQATALPVQSCELGSGQGLLLFANHLSQAEKIGLLQQYQQLLDQEKTTPGPAQTDSLQADTKTPCQVTVEERAQLFAFLNNV